MILKGKIIGFIMKIDFSISELYHQQKNIKIICNGKFLKQTKNFLQILYFFLIIFVFQISIHWQWRKNIQQKNEEKIFVKIFKFIKETYHTGKKWFPTIRESFYFECRFLGQSQMKLLQNKINRNCENKIFKLKFLFSIDFQLLLIRLYQDLFVCIKRFFTLFFTFLKIPSCFKEDVRFEVVRRLNDVRFFCVFQIFSFKYFQ